MNINLTNRLDTQNIIIIPLGGEPFSNNKLCEYMQEIDNQKAWYSQDSVYPVGLSGNNNCYLIAVEFGKEDLYLLNV